ncbi:phosphotransferase [Sphaerisporangium sp. NPDC005288]|uniref:phosphotransferase family protein n=1 Tax=Sphaerisporangium sp. NPDC005288 TaxID=3155114 RepID=UPI0033B7FC5C
MLTPPRDLPDGVLASALAREWGLAAVSLTYRPVGFAIPHRDELEAALRGAPGPGASPGEDLGPYARPAAALPAEHAAPLRRLLELYDDLVAAGRGDPSRMVLTHGETHSGNTMLAASGGWMLIDWETSLVAPPERDLWNLDPGDGSILAAYTAATGIAPLPTMLRLYHIRWDLADIALETTRFRRPHRGGPDDDKGWRILHDQVTGVSALA